MFVVVFPENNEAAYQEGSQYYEVLIPFIKAHIHTHTHTHTKTTHTQIAVAAN